LISLRYRYRPVIKKSRTLVMVTKGSPTLLIVHQRYIPFYTVTVTVIFFFNFQNRFFTWKLKKNSFSLLIQKLQMTVYTLAGKDIYEGRAY
jgi:hypothetical protein